jgi:hypothetical protein
MLDNLNKGHKALSMSQRPTAVTKVGYPELQSSLFQPWPSVHFSATLVLSAMGIWFNSPLLKISKIRDYVCH